MTYGFKNAGRGSATSAVCVALFVALLLPATSSADPASLRRWPYPFSGVMSFASDVDMQPPWYGAAFHGAVNEELGLPISDSLWVSGAGSGQSNLLSSVDEINRTPSGWNGHSTFGLLVRQWHRGNIDIFHSWQNDAWVRLYEDFVPAAQLLSSAVELKLAPAPPESAEMKYQVLRLFFDGNPPEDLVVVLKDAGGNKAVASDLKRFHLLHRNGAPYAVEALLETIGDATVWKSSPGFSLQALRTVEIQAQSCSAGCKAGVTRLERDGFSRSVVARQLPIVEGLNLRPAILTSHGGYTYAQNFGYEGCCRPLATSSGSIFDRKGVSNLLETEAATLASVAYHADLLARLGVIGVWPIQSDRGLSESKIQGAFRIEPMPGTSFYAVPRTLIPFPIDISNVKTFAHSFRTALPNLAALDPEPHYCNAHSLCDAGAGGSLLGLLIDIGTVMTDAGKPAEHFWYTHFGTVAFDPSYRARPDQPLKEAVWRSLQGLAERYYGLAGVVPRRRLWVPPAGVLVRYEVAAAHAAEHIAVGRDGSSVHISSWVDPVTGRRIPDLRAGTRDLHGITVYVRSAAEASVDVDGRAVETFTRNPPDETGRQSVTIVGDNVPTVLIGGLPLSESGTSVAAGGTLTGTGTAHGWTTLASTGTGTGAAFVFRPHDLRLWNTSHMRVSYRVRGQPAVEAVELAIEVIMPDRGTVFAATPAIAAPAESASWEIPKPLPAGRWAHVTLAACDLKWPTVMQAGFDGLPLPVGRVGEIVVKAKGLHAGASLDLRLEALRASANGVPDDGHALLAGRATWADGSAAGGVPVSAHWGRRNQESAISDGDGYFFLQNVPRGSVVELAAAYKGLRCSSRLGEEIELLRDEAEADINLAECAAPVRQTPGPSLRRPDGRVSTESGNVR